MLPSKLTIYNTLCVSFHINLHLQAANIVVIRAKEFDGKSPLLFFFLCIFLQTFTLSYQFLALVRVSVLVFLVKSLRRSCLFINFHFWRHNCSTNYKFSKCPEQCNSHPEWIMKVNLNFHFCPPTKHPYATLLIGWLKWFVVLSVMAPDP